ncbi:L-alanine-DL-glutamate epimerase-like enolase superfamily enzyme [Zeaxanthinibacter enoshimensis]|uniref:Dipeptide epimerase n=1 Tax=Zeaxanthinibacter enoshimensis TaxID=392009 RepID=A0A4V3D3F0_9FLAO|nr:L-alanine-DL-glutamate epimerase-like enolase superfamily enzyme [Zeaxanthinibacter enoshimensis]
MMSRDLSRDFLFYVDSLCILVCKVKHTPVQLSLATYKLPLKHTFRISRESITHQDTLIVSLSKDGHTGFGEATTNSYYNASVGQMTAEIEAQRDTICSYQFEYPEAFHAFLKELPISNFSRCALDIAAHDLYGKIKGEPLYSLWGTDPSQYPLTNYTIGIDSIENMVAKMKEKPWPLYKIKLGTADDVAIVRELRKHTDSVFRIDANGAWSAKETISNAPVLKELGVEFLEQPLAAGDWEGMEKVMHYSVLPVIADESCIVETDVERCALHYHGINIKLVKCGGLTPALRMIKRGKELGLKIMVGCMTESTVGISAVAQLLPQLDYVDMDGAMLLAEDIAHGVSIASSGKVIFPEKPGTGVTLLS